jgi:hypothetical protein
LFWLLLPSPSGKRTAQGSFSSAAAHRPQEGCGNGNGQVVDFLLLAPAEQPADCGGIDAVAAPQVSLRLARREPRQHFLALVMGELVRRSELHALGLRSGSALACPGPDQFPFEIGSKISVAAIRYGHAVVISFDRITGLLNWAHADGSRSFRYKCRG